MSPRRDGQGCLAEIGLFVLVIGGVYVGEIAVRWLVDERYGDLALLLVWRTIGSYLLLLEIERRVLKRRGS